MVNVEVGAGIRNWADVTASAHLFDGKDLLDTNMFELSMEANADALEKLIGMKNKLGLSYAKLSSSWVS